MRIAFVTDGPTVRDILGHLGEPTAPPRIAPARCDGAGSTSDDNERLLWMNT